MLLYFCWLKLILYMYNGWRLHGFIILITHQLKVYLPLVDDILNVLWICYHGNNDVLFKKLPRYGMQDVDFRIQRKISS